MLMKKIKNKMIPVLSKLSDLILLNIIFILFSIPVITIGSSLTAMYYVLLKIEKNEESYIFKSFVKSFKLNLVQGIQLTLTLILPFLLLLLNLFIFKFEYIKYMNIFLLFLISSIMFYAFPLLAKYDNSNMNILKNSLILTIANLPRTIVYVLCTWTILIISITNIKLGVILIPFWFFILFSGIGYISSKYLNKIFDKMFSNNN